MGFKDSINQILSLLPKQRRTGLFSATQTKELKDLIRAGMRNPVSIVVRVNIDSNLMTENSNNKTMTGLLTQSIVPSTLSNYYQICSYENRPAAIVKFISQHLNSKIIVFLSTCACVDYYSAIFNQLRLKQMFFPSNFTILGNILYVV